MCKDQTGNSPDDQQKEDHELETAEQSNMYRSLAKKGPWAEHLTSQPKKGVGALSTVSAFNHERASTSCLQRLEPSKQIIAHKITYNGITSGFEVES